MERTALQSQSNAPAIAWLRSSVHCAADACQQTDIHKQRENSIGGAAAKPNQQTYRGDAERDAVRIDCTAKLRQVLNELGVHQSHRRLRKRAHFISLAIDGRGAWAWGPRAEPESYLDCAVRGGRDRVNGAAAEPEKESEDLRTCSSSRVMGTCSPHRSPPRERAGRGNRRTMHLVPGELRVHHDCKKGSNAKPSPNEFHNTTQSIEVTGQECRQRTGMAHSGTAWHGTHRTPCTRTGAPRLRPPQPC